MLIKICGLSTPETIAAAAEAGASHVGLVHFAPSPRHVDLAEAAQLRATVPAGVKAVLLLVNADAETTARAIDKVRPDVVQFHGKETPEWVGAVRERAGIEVWKAMGVRSAETLANSARYEGAVDRLLFDAPPPAAGILPGGNGALFDWSLLKDHDHRIPWGLAGGLTPDTVPAPIRVTGTPADDVSSVVESRPGEKDPDMIRRFLRAAKTANNGA